MKIYVDVNAKHDGNGTKQLPFRSINEAAKVAAAGDDLLAIIMKTSKLYCVFVKKYV